LIKRLGLEWNALFSDCPLKRSRELGLLELLFHNLREDVTSLDSNLVEVRLTVGGGLSDLGSGFTGIEESFGVSRSISNSGVPAGFILRDVAVSDSLSLFDSVTNLSSNFGNRIDNTIRGSTRD
jgi:hypothetical protein